ncbi:hypothetical protein [Chitinophaga sp. RAB17]|uniref:hypothetical protein n=1 Tax=Chitinophaga sp. RAB17 TaxID=3233049 RepID=UPI003F92D80D
MTSGITFPESLTDFLYWIKETTEFAWSKSPNVEFSPEYSKIMYGAKWMGLNDQEINEIEREYSIKFGSEHREFLKILHTVNRNRSVAIDENDPTAETPPAFYNWIADKPGIERRLDWPYRTILQDVLEANKIWLKSWGPRPEFEKEKSQVFSDWFNSAPKLLPIRDRTFLMDHSESGLKPLLSVCGSDVIIAGWSLRHFLLREFAVELSLVYRVYEEEGQYYYNEIISGIDELDQLETIRLDDAEIPYWKEMITYWSSNWQGYRV